MQLLRDKIPQIKPLFCFCIETALLKFGDLEEVTTTIVLNKFTHEFGVVQLRPIIRYTEERETPRLYYRERNG
jgi:hypothetical protein